ncbi:MAG: glycerophosphodiester phosphodiesterase family protein [Lawsonella clevelandensis]
MSYLEVGGDIIKAAKQLNAQVLSPDYGSANDLYANAAFCTRAHKAGLKVVPYTVDSEEAMRNQIKAGADGIITNYPVSRDEGGPRNEEALDGFLVRCRGVGALCIGATMHL